MAEKVVSVMDEHGVNFLRGVVLRSIVKNAEGSLEVEMSNGETRTYDTVIFATGRSPETRGLGLGPRYLSKAGKILAEVESGRVVGRVYSVGDVVEGQRELTPVAIR